MNGNMPAVASVLITGCSSGFGKLTALLFARHGHTVFATMRDTARAGPMAAMAQEEGLDVRVLALDVTDDASVRSAVAEAEAAAGGALDVVVNNAGVELRGAVESVSDPEVLAQFDTNVFGVIRVVRAVLPAMRERGRGVIVNVSSIAGLVARPYGGIYSATKFAMEAISEALHHELRSFGIRVAVVEPGQFETALLANAVIADAFGPDSPYRESSDRFDVAIQGLSPDGKRAPADVVAETIVAVAFDDDAGLRHLVGSDAELVMSVRNSGDFEHFDRTIRDALNWE
jgi:NAD(P)-dependent dehydrogenase (short-subunit alcohol dehydrogenase family)